MKPVHPVTILDIFLTKGASITHKTPSDDNLFIFVIKGKGNFGSTENSQELGEDGAASK